MDRELLTHCREQQNNEGKFELAVMLCTKPWQSPRQGPSNEDRERVQRGAGKTTAELASAESFLRKPRRTLLKIDHQNTRSRPRQPKTIRPTGVCLVASSLLYS